MDAVGYVKLVLRRWKDFTGRSRRAEYWWFYLAMFLLQIVERALLRVVDGAPLLQIIFGLAVFVVSLALLVPSLAVSFRRMHDIDRSAWWLLLWFIPIIGWIVLIVFHATRGTVGPNRFGPDPIAEGPVVSPDPIVQLNSTPARPLVRQFLDLLEEGRPGRRPNRYGVRLSRSESRAWPCTRSFRPPPRKAPTLRR